MNDLIFYNALNQIPALGSVRLRKLLNHFPNMEVAWDASSAEYHTAGLEDHVAAEIMAARKTIDPAAEFQKLEKLGVRLLTLSDGQYPKLLREIPDPPVVLYLRGQLATADEFSVAVVGTRKMSPYGRQVTEDLVRGLAAAKITIVSGLAFGVDACAHRTALESGTRTIAVLACGADSIYPANNRQLGEAILQRGGAIISEFPLGTPPLKHHFVVRNRIIAGLALGTVVVEAAEESGALITARHALEQNRQVFAVPGSIYNPASAGPNNLLKMGAKPVTTAADILEDLNLGHLQEQVATQEIIPDNNEEAAILKHLTREPQHFDLLAKSSGLPAAQLAATLTIMEMKGKVRNLGANQYVVSR